ncbi:Two component regulator propeller [Sphingobacterium multivorum]|uniref:Two component regulator propeller n=1 Tax=Sphingobacterium multivorum TaxID=28454 RepID=A0A2X2JGL2_SPHMU|nr:two-component regulator propeller domain-containing protein [Sphingobacterium multivorum]SPZ92884.1 Two component regulator propeller [Sphingobacterium multivorum]
MDPKSGYIQNFSDKQGNLANNNIHGILPIGDKLLIGTFVNGLDIFSPKLQKVIYHIDRNSNVSTSDLQSNFLFYLYKTRKGEIMAASTRGLYRFDLEKKSFHLIDNVPEYMFYTSILEDKKGNIWVGTWRDDYSVIIRPHVISNTIRIIRTISIPCPTIGSTVY